MIISHFKNLNLKNIEGEIWRDVIGYEGIYKISNKGRVKSENRLLMYDRKLGRGIEPKRVFARIRKQKLNKHTGYLMIGLSLKGKPKQVTIHSLVGESFLNYKRGQGMKSYSNFINHKDGNKLNNNLENLEVITLKENVRHMFKQGLSTTNHRVLYKGIKYYSKSEMRRQLNMPETRQIKLIKNGECKVL